MYRTTIKCIADLLHHGHDQIALADRFVEINREVWPDVPERYLWTREKVLSQFLHCPNTIYCATKNGVVVGTMSAIYLNEHDALNAETWEITSADGTFLTHNKNGDSAFGLDLSVLPSAQGKDVGDQLVEKSILFFVILSGKKGVFLGSRVPGFRKRSATTTIEDHVFGKNGRSRDPEVRMYQNDGFNVIRIIPGYMEDPDSCNYGVLMFYPNPFYRYTRWIPKKIMDNIARLARRWLL